MKPLIGITTGEIYNLTSAWSPQAYGQSYTYSDAVIRAGGVPVLIPITSDMDTLKQLYAKLDGILFAGGNDINPKLYGEEATEYTTDVSDRRDDIEMTLLKWTLRDKKPMLGICRGAQLWNALQGGSLYQNIPTDLPAASDHDISTKLQDLEHLAHALKVDESSCFADIIHSNTINANTHHHQAFKVLGEGIQASAWAEDGIIEAIESHDDSYAIGVQCHPESLHDVEPKWNLVFRSFILSSSK
ncbi:MAG: peptidase [Candidatus Saccharibacteria bacterium]|nr:peptidase [Candidatus Saccharibacteria bacterium]